MTGVQVQEARKLLKLTRFRLGQQCGIREDTIRTFETTGTVPRTTKAPEHLARRLAAPRTALKIAGVVVTDDEEPGVKLRKVEG